MRALRFTLLPAFLLQIAAVAVVPAPASAALYDFTEIVHTGDAVPGGTGSFVSIDQPPSAIVGEVLFGGKGSDGEVGLYRLQIVEPPTGIQLVADNATPIPGGQGNFTGFGSAALGGSSVALRGSGSGGQDGVYIIMPNNIVADLATPIPGGQGNFTAFAGVAFDGSRVAFRGSGSGGQEGVYIIMPNNIVADLATPIPGGQLGTFTAFSPDVFLDQGVVAFGGNGPPGYSGFFQDDGNGLVTLVDTFTPVPGAVGENFSGFEEASFVKGAIAFHGFGANGSEGIYITEAIGPSCIVASKGDPIPGGQDKYTGFGAVSYDGTHVAFIGLGSKVILSDLGGTLEPVVAVGDVIGNLVVADLSIGPDALNGNTVTFWASFTDGSEGIYMATSTGQVDVGRPAPAAAFRARAEPNPFVLDTDIRFTLPAGGEVTLELFDVAGRPVARRSRGFAPAGAGRIRVDGGDLQRGVYFYRLSAGPRTATGRLVKVEAR